MTDDEFFLSHGYSPMAAKTLLVDFDGTLYPRSGLWDEPQPFEGAKRALKRFKAHGYRIVIHTSRLDPKYLDADNQYAADQRAHMERLLKRDGIPFDDFAPKPSGAAYIDDLGVHFDGDWKATADWVLFSRDR